MALVLGSLSQRDIRHEALRCLSCVREFPHTLQPFIYEIN